MDFNKLWANFMDNVQNHYMDFNGRMPRAQFWYFVLVCFVINIIAAIVGSFVTGLVGAIVGLALLLPMGGAAARRMQDTGRSGQLVWIWVVVSGVYQIFALLLALSGPLGALAFLAFFFTLGSLISLAMLVVSIAIIYFCAQPGQAEANAYGPVPPAWTPN